MASKRELVAKWFIDNNDKVLGYERQEILTKLVHRFDVSEKTANAYYYDWKKKNVSPNSVPKKRKVVKKEEVNEVKTKDKIRIIETQDNKRIKKLKMSKEIEGKYYNYKIDEYGKVSVIKENEILKIFSNIDEVKKFEINENMRFEKEMQELKDIFKVVG